MQLFSDDYLMHYGVKGMRWKKKKKKKEEEIDYYDPRLWKPSESEQKKEGFSYSQYYDRARKLIKKYNKQQAKKRKTTEKWARKHGLAMPHHKSTEHIDNPSLLGILQDFQEAPKKKDTVYRRSRIGTKKKHPGLSGDFITIRKRKKALGRGR